ncbi:MAG TPA: fasciclin domain-containing protein, partial [Anseongella sp.]|nr:fasciclin domain-containing protein [Anseongella sp.]
VRTEEGFRKRYYPTEYGYILFDNGKFYDYTGHSVSLRSETPTWERSKGAIYEIDGFLTPLYQTDTTLTVYNLLRKDPALSGFASACARAGLARELNLTGFFTYTLLAPTNEALLNAGIDPGALSGEALLEFVNAHIIPNRYIFSDGVFNGQIADRNGEYATVNGAWGGFSVTGASGTTLTPAEADIQGSNGVVHKVAQVF